MIPGLYTLFQEKWADKQAIWVYSDPILVIKNSPLEFQVVLPMKNRLNLSIAKLVRKMF